MRVFGLVVFLFFTSPITAQLLQSRLPTFDRAAVLHVIAILDPECPISQKYTKPLNELATAYESKHAKVYGVVAVRNIQQVEVDDFIYQYALSFPCVRDHELEIASTIGASVTPEVFLLDRDLKVIYSGAIDDWFFDLGRSKRKATTHFLIDAIESHLAGESIELKRTDPVGCRISYPKPSQK